MCDAYKKNYYLAGSLLNDIGTKSKQDLLQLYLNQHNILLSDFIEKHQHYLYHLFSNERCCQCTGSTRLVLSKHDKVLRTEQMKTLFASKTKMSCHKPGSKKPYCCSRSNVILNVKDLDITLLHCLFINICLDLFWNNYLMKSNKTFVDFLNEKTHLLFHLWKPNDICFKCNENNQQCTSNASRKLNDNQWGILYETTTCECICTETCTCPFSPKKGIKASDLEESLARVILRHCCPLFMSIETIVKSRNDLAHNKDGELSDIDFKTVWTNCRKSILTIAKLMENQKQVEADIDVLAERMPSNDVCNRLHIQFSDTFTRIEDIDDNTLQLQEMMKDLDATTLQLKKNVIDLNSSHLQLKETMLDLDKKAEGERIGILRLLQAKIEHQETSINSSADGALYRLMPNVMTGKDAETTVVSEFDAMNMSYKGDVSSRSYSSQTQDTCKEKTTGVTEYNEKEQQVLYSDLMCEEYQRNYYLGLLLNQIGTKSKQNLLNFYLEKNSLSLSTFINNHQHELYHLFCIDKCCQCTSSILTNTQKLLDFKEMNLLFDNRSKMQCHNPASTKAYCCCISKTILNVDDLDITLLHYLLTNICLDLFWYSCLFYENKTFETFLDDNIHVLFHLWKRNDNCCKSKERNLQCKLDLSGKINDTQWAILFETTRRAVRCNNTDTCHFSAKRGILEYNLDNDLARVILGNICPLFMSIQKLAQSRYTLAQNKKVELSNMEYKNIWSDSTKCIIAIARFLGKENQVKADIDALKDKMQPSDVYNKLPIHMLETHTLIEDSSINMRADVNQLKKDMHEVTRIVKKNHRADENQIRDIVGKMMLEFFTERTVSSGIEFQPNTITKELEGANSDDSALDSYKCGKCKQMYEDDKEKLVLIILKHTTECPGRQVRSAAPGTSTDHLQETSIKVELGGLSKNYEDETIQSLKATNGLKNQSISFESVDQGSIIIWGRISNALCYTKTSIINAVEDFLRTLFITYPSETNDASGITLKVGLVINEGNELDDEDDYLLCGKCKSEFLKVSQYISHQRNECELSRLEETEQSEKNRNSSKHVIPAGFVPNFNKRFEGNTCEPVIQKNDDKKDEGLIMSRSDKEHISTATKTIFSLKGNTEKRRIDDIQAGTSVDVCADVSASNINIESSSNIRGIDVQTGVNQVEMEQENEYIVYGSVTPSVSLPSEMIRNSNGGFSFEVDDLTLLHRYICLGVENRTSYDSQCIDRLLHRNRGSEVLNLLVDLSVNGRAMRQAPILHLLAICATCNDLKIKAHAFQVLPTVCRIPVHLFEFISFCKRETSGSGWGRPWRAGISNWYNSFENNPMKLAYLVTKYKARHGWNHRDVVKLAHIKPINRHIALILRYITDGLAEITRLARYDESSVDVMNFFDAVERTGKNTATGIDELKRLVVRHNLVQEHIHHNFLGNSDLWGCLLRQMPITTMLRNLGKMASLFLLETNSFGEKLVTSKLDILNEPRIHPLNIFFAWKQYATGHGHKGHLSWPVNDYVKDALENAFFKSFGLFQPTNKRICIAVEVSGSMQNQIFGSDIKVLDIAAAMVLLIARIEKDYRVVAFADEIKCLNINKEDSLEDVIKAFRCIPYGGSDCALPIKWAVEEKIKFDAFIVFTSSESFSGNMHFTEALRHYRSYISNTDVCAIVVGMANNGFSIADPCDPLVLDIVGFDKNAPKAIKTFLNKDY